MLVGYPAAVHYLAEVGSTNDWARARMCAGGVHGEAVVANEQSAGRGRHGRVWYSPPLGNLYVTVLARPEVAVTQVSQLTLAAGVAMAEALEEAFGLRVALKWPNDLVVGGQKLGGILCEGVMEGTTLLGVVVGVGVNLRGGAERFPKALRAVATTLEMALGEGVDERARDVLLGAFLPRAYGWLRPVGGGDLAAVRAAWRRWAWLPVGVRLGDGREGEAYGLAEDGGLQVRLEEGGEVVVRSGEVTWDWASAREEKK